MVETIIFVLGITAISLLLKNHFKIPVPLSILPMAMILANVTGQNLIDVGNNGFDAILLGLLPLLIATDVLALKFKEVKENSLSLFYVAVISVVISILVGAFLGNFILSEYALPVTLLIMLFCMNTATDPIAVVNVLSTSKLPHSLGFIAESESLANDAVALIVYSICGSVFAMSHSSDITFASITMHSVMIVMGAIFIGLAVGYIGLLLLRLTSDEKIETTILLLVAYVSFEIAEMFHYSGILAIIVSLMLANTVIQKRIAKDDIVIDDLLDHKKSIDWIPKYISMAIVDKANHESVHDYFNLLAVIATTILFVSMASMISLDLLMKYWSEIVMIFLVVTASRKLMMASFALISNRVRKMRNIKLHWWAILSLAGVKGALSILMLHMLPETTPAATLELFEAITIGNILLSTFIYPPLMMLIITMKKYTFEKEYYEEIH